MTCDEQELLRAAQAWLEGDPDPDTRAELAELVGRREFSELSGRMLPLSFGTAGLRARVGAGPGRMNRAVVLRTAWGIARQLRAPSAPPGGLVVIGFDARPTSRGFAEASAGVFLAAGFAVALFPEAIATPLVAFAAREFLAVAAIVVTASHNPRADNGYKVYASNGAQITTPQDSAIAAEISLAPPARQVPRIEVSLAAGAPLPAGLTLVAPALLDRYFAAMAAALPPGSTGRELRIVYSALHGVGWGPVRRALAEAGFSGVRGVPEQLAPDGGFPTTPFPNPEEPGTLDLALSLGEQTNAELVLVNDPDADRLGAAARLDGVLVALDGNQIGALLASHVLATRRGAQRAIVLTSVVSSPLVEALARASGAHHERTLTGFKWLWNAALALERAQIGTFCFAWEEALGYSVLPEVRDKDGISAARALAELAAELRERGETLFDRLFELYCQHGLWASAARNLALSPSRASELRTRLDALALRPPPALLGQRVERVIDYRHDVEQRPPWLGEAALLELQLEGGGRLFIRPSGTEPKLKLYAHVRHNVRQRAELQVSLREARASAARLLEHLEVALGL